LNTHFVAPGSEPTKTAGYYTTSSTPAAGMPGPLLRLKGGMESATPSVNAVIARSLLRLSTTLEEERYRTLARQTCHAFAVEVLQHPFLFTGLLDVIVGLELGTRNVTGVVATAETPSTESRVADQLQQSGQSNTVQEVIRKVRAEAGVTTSTSLTAISVVDIQPSSSASTSTPTENRSSWLKSRNPLFKDLQPTGTTQNRLLICEKGSCRIVKL
jgi:uncharacterized protein YyaL (SSP411 family)